MRLKYFQAAAHDAPQEPAAWQGLVTFCFGCGRIDDAIAAAGEASRKLTGATGFELIRNKRSSDLIKNARDIAGVRPLLMSLRWRLDRRCTGA